MQYCGKSIGKNKLPKHIAFIMDGNGRWAKKNNLKIKTGHIRGMDAAENIITECEKLGVKYITLYAFSTENWKRSNNEVNDLINLIGVFFKKKIKNLIQKKTKINIIGDIDKFPATLE